MMLYFTLADMEEFNLQGRERMQIAEHEVWKYSPLLATTQSGIKLDRT